MNDQQSEELQNFIINFTVGDMPPETMAQCGGVIKMSLKYGGNLLLIAIEMGVSDTKLMEYYNEEEIRHWRKQYKQGFRGWQTL